MKSKAAGWRVFPGLVLAACMAAGSASAAAVAQSRGKAPRAQATVPAPAPAPAQQVVKLAAGAVAFAAEGDGFRRDGPVGDRLTLPAPVLEVSPRGYVRVEGSTGPLWLDELDVDLDPPRTAQAANCYIVSSTSSTQLAASRGAGEGCSR